MHEHEAALERFRMYLENRKNVMIWKGFSSVMVIFAGVLDLNISAHIPYPNWRAVSCGFGAGLMLAGLAREMYYTRRMIRDAQRGLEHARRQLQETEAKFHQAILEYTSD